MLIQLRNQAILTVKNQVHVRTNIPQKIWETHIVI